MPDKRRAWTVMLVASLAGVAVTVNQFEVLPALRTLMPALSLDMAAGDWLMDHAPHRTAVPAVALAVTGILFWWGFRLESAGIVTVYMLALGFSSNVIPTAVFTLAPETVKGPASIGLAMAAINVVSNLGVLLGPPLLGLVVANGQRSDGSTLLLAATLLGILAALLAWRSMGDA